MKGRGQAGRQGDDFINTRTQRIITIFVYKFIMGQGALLATGSDIATTFAISPDCHVVVI